MRVIILFLSGAFALMAFIHSSAAQSTQPLCEADRCNFIIGTQTFGSSYQFTSDPPLLEAARAIRALGSTVIKFQLGDNYAHDDRDARNLGNILEKNPAIQSLTQLARDEPTHRAVLDMPFANYVLWAHSFSNSGRWIQHFDPHDQAAEYRELYDLTHYLLVTYNGTGKSFYLGHWEGDGWLRHSVAKEDDKNITPDKCQRMIDWLNTRQRAIDDAKRDTPHQDVQVWHYTEVNHVKLAMDENRPALVNQVLPHVPIDYVSYSSYDTQNDPALLKRAMDFIEARLSPKPTITGKRVFIGEFGFPTSRFTPDQQDKKSRQVLQAALEWGCPFALYWELYNNEIKGNHQMGFWMIDDKRVKQPVYQTYRRFYTRSENWTARFATEHHRLPTSDEFRPQALRFLDD